MKWTVCLVAVVMATTSTVTLTDAAANATCDEGYWACKDGKDGCILQRERCDGYGKCSDYSDELDCEGNCGEDTFECVYHGLLLCRPNSFKCDQSSDCDDHSDEDGCQEPDCPMYSFMCKAAEGGYQKCFRNREKCDQITHCLDGSDEVDCADNSCRDETTDKFLVDKDGQLLTCEEYLDKFGYYACEPGNGNGLAISKKCCETCHERSLKYNHLPAGEDCKFGDRNDAWCKEKDGKWAKLCENNAKKCCATCSPTPSS